jgi:hypothetical protein
MSEQRPERIDFEDELRRLAKADPFTPFEIIVTSGDRYEITEELQMAISGNAVVVLMPKRGMQMFRKNQIVAVHTLESAN